MPSCCVFELLNDVYGVYHSTLLTDATSFWKELLTSEYRVHFTVFPMQTPLKGARSRLCQRPWWEDLCIPSVQGRSRSHAHGTSSFGLSSRMRICKINECLVSSAIERVGSPPSCSGPSPRLDPFRRSREDALLARGPGPSHWQCWSTLFFRGILKASACKLTRQQSPVIALTQLSNLLTAPASNSRKMPGCV